eukprot:TRINITY_DN5920_c0_g1_i1.p1 TRINITY_DN5920_c0_g1~~TRINITY_DN5920_c0_g1_i1.p1  ORF type:complete len:536 (+),score=167.21 TRINITY_DN5920_c0_g1_i1:53-1660(+)
MAAVQRLNQHADIARKSAALAININSAKGLQEVMKTNLGPKGTIKMLVSGAGDIKLTKDGAVLLHEMQIQHPTASLIARSATAQDDITGDGTTSNVLLIGELLRQTERFLAEGIHPRVLTDGIEIGRQMSLEFLDKFAVKKTIDKELLMRVAQTSLRTKLQVEMADTLTEIVVDSVLTIQQPQQALDLHMVELMTMQHKDSADTSLIRGLVLDHGARHPDMPKRADNAFILILNVSLEYEKTEVNSGFYFSSADQREKLVASERSFTDDRVRKIIELKKQVCDTPDKSFVVINQQGIDPPSLDMLAKEGILSLRRAKRRNMERLALIVGGSCANSTEDMTPEVLGWAGKVYEHTLGEEKYTFVEDCKHPKSCTILVKGPNKHTIEQIKDAVRDGLRAVKNAIDDQSVIPGAGAFEVACHAHISSQVKTVTGRARLGLQSFADALLVIPKTLAENAGQDAQDALIKLQDAHTAGCVFGLDLVTGEAQDVDAAGIWDNYRVKRQILQSMALTSMQLLLVDEIMRAGRGASKGDVDKY